MPSPTYDVIVVGAGPVGLAAAWRLTTKGHQVIVVERRPGIDTTGMGGDIQMSPNATLLCRKVGLAPLLEGIANQKHFLTIHDNDAEMNTLTEVPLDFSKKVPSLMFRRADLQRRLFDVATKAGAKVEFGKEVVEVHDSSSSRPKLTFADGEKMSADLIIAADGVRSTVRTHAFPNRDTQPIALDEVCFQWNVPYSTMAESADTLALWEEGKQCCGIVISTGTYLVYWANEARQEMFLIFTKPKYDKPVEVGSWNKSADVEEIKCLFQDYPATVRTMVDKCQAAEHWRITDSVKGADWVTPGGKIVLVGDAKHAMPPHQAQGIGQGLEDVMGLAEFIDAAPTAQRLEKALREFGRFRDPRVERILLAARTNAANFCLPHGEARKARDAAWKQFKATAKVVQAYENASTSWEDVAQAGPTSFNFQKWIQTYDVLQEAERHIHAHLLETRL